MNFLTGTQSLNGGRAETNMSQNNSFWGFPPINELRCTFIQTPSSNENTYLRRHVRLRHVDVRSLRRSQRYLLAFGLGFALLFFFSLLVLTWPPQLHGIQSCLLLSGWSQDVGLHLPSRLFQRLYPQLQVSPSVARTGPMTSRLEILLRQTERALVTEGNRIGIQIRGTSSPFPRRRGGKKARISMLHG